MVLWNRHTYAKWSIYFGVEWKSSSYLIIHYIRGKQTFIETKWRQYVWLNRLTHSSNGLEPVWRQSIAWSNDDVLSVGARRNTLEWHRDISDQPAGKRRNNNVICLNNDVIIASCAHWVFFSAYKEVNVSINDQIRLYRSVIETERSPWSHEDVHR